MEKVVKRALGYSKPKENEDYTHVIFSKEEYNVKHVNKIRDLEDSVKQLEKNYNAALEKYKRSADDKIKEIRAQADERVAEAEAKADSFENMNRNLIRVATERANAKRGLTPKKQHIGYVFLSIEEFTFNCECTLSNSRKTKVLKLPCFKVRLQSPYDVSFDLKSAKDMIENDFDSKHIYGMLNIASVYENMDGWSEDELINLWNKHEKNFIFKTVYKAVFQRGFWEIEYLTRYIVSVHSDMFN